ncbi:MAG: aminotransferase class I/II-fold pyridoxal phosphate-dependent enzyme [Saprospiraceae bacterium]|nr:aminotransferase class I/II-fold pyridoxal phosphate-dependent enzyme [Saprospiraceae bacterium]
MSNLNRRKWLQLTGLASSATLVPKSLWSTETSFQADSTDHIARLSANENPLGPSKKMRDAVIAGFEEDCRYPFGKMNTLIEAIAKKEDVRQKQIVITGGSMEGLKAAGLTFGVHGGEIVAPDPTFQSLLSYAVQFGVHINRVPLTAELQHDLEEMERRISYDTKLVFLCNPNNPTGALIDALELRQFCERVSHKTIVFSDEAYYDYIEDAEYPSMIKLVKEGANVVVSRTFSKVYGIAGMRVGYLIAREDIAARIRPYVMAYTNMPAIHAALAALDDKEFYAKSLQHNSDAKKRIYDALEDVNLEYLPSHTNFVFFKTGRPISEVQKSFRDQGVQVGRPFPPLTNWCRVSTGLMHDVDKFVQALKHTFG